MVYMLQFVHRIRCKDKRQKGRCKYEDNKNYDQK